MKMRALVLMSSILTAMGAHAQAVTDAQIASIVVTANQVDVDAGKVAESMGSASDVKKFGKLENKKVTAKGTIVHRPGVESKDRMVLVVQKIKEWKAPQAEKPSNY